MLAYSSFALLKENMPEASVYALVPHYTSEMAETCPWVDHILIDPSPKAGWRSGFALSELFKKERFDAVITLYSRARVGLASVLSKIPYRFAPATRFAQIFYNHRLTQRRSRSEKPEYVYNEDLIRHFLKQQKISSHKEPGPPYLHFDDHEIAQKRLRFCETHQLDPQNALVFLHSGSGGSANNLTVEQYAKLANHLKSGKGHTIILTAGPGELEHAKILGKQLPHTPHVVYYSTFGLQNFAKHIQFADVFISGSTGPLHIAGALDTPTAAFYPRRRSATALRWQTLNSPKRRLGFSPDEKHDDEKILNVDLEKAAGLISERFLS